MSRNTDDILVSIVTPVYNRASYIAETIESVLDQDYKNIEYILIDDGSTDNSLEIIRDYSDRVIYSRHENIGETLTVNKAFTKCRGDIIGVVNSDDPLLPGALSKIVQYAKAYKNACVFYPDWLMIDQHGIPLRHIQTFEYSFANMLRWHHCMPGPGTFFRREVLEELGGRDPQFRYVGDFDFWLRAALLGEFRRIPEELATFRVHDDSASVKHQGTRMAIEHIKLVDTFFSNDNLTEEIKELRAEAYSSAYFVAGSVCGRGSYFDMTKFFLLSYAKFPQAFYLYKKRIVAVLYCYYRSIFNIRTFG